ncbi:hypothetical protein EGW08_006183 [Elysia chlorotica]|uniref:DUF6451 domain-containing protein n=1 Tax=Elysia chlorotica TaxID=188477 RepID=A0A3S1BKP3_ELYCH|nr:hypothetical protein EGW08_006183 [Elysia chlorotica]
MRGADAASDHNLLIASLKIKLKAYRDQAERPSHKYNVHSLKDKETLTTFKCDLKNRFQALESLPDETIEEHWQNLRETWTTTCMEVLGKKTRKRKEWLTPETWDIITERKRLNDLINHTDEVEHNRDLQEQYWAVNRQVKRSARDDKRKFIHDLTEEAETAAGQRNMKRLYEITRTLSGKNSNPTRPVKGKNGETIKGEEEQRARWAEHFRETLNRPPPATPPDIPPAAQLLDISTNPPTKAEITKAIKSTKIGKAAGPDGIPPEALTADIQTCTDMLHPLLTKIWENECVPVDWKKGHLENIKEVDKFVYLGSIVSKDGGTDEDIGSRINKARHAFRTLRSVWSSSALAQHNKIRIFNSNVKSVLLYGSETWRTTKTNTQKLQTFINRCLRNILNIRWPEVISNQDLWERTRQAPIEQEIKKRKWGWIGHTLRKPSSNTTMQSLEWNPQGKLKVGRPRQTWRRSTDTEARATGMTWAELRRTSQNRVRWRSVVAALCSYRSEED